MAIPGAGTFALQVDSVIEDFDLLVQPGYGYSDLTSFITGFLELNQYSHLTIFRDDSYAMYAIMSESFSRFARDRNPVLYMNTVVSIIRSKRATLQTYKVLLKAAHERSRG